MKKIQLIPVLLLGLILSCKDSSQTVSPSSQVDMIAYNAQLQAEVDSHPSINAPVIVQDRVKSIEGSLNSRMNISVQYDYYTDGKIKSVSYGNILAQEYVYKNDILTADKTYILDKNGLAQSLNDNSQTKFFYKDGFLLRTNTSGAFKYSYSTIGNLTKAEIGNEALNYVYTDYPNTIRQEVLKLQEYSNSMRDSYLGRFSTNLIKEIKYDDMTVMTYDYEFDAQKRVTKVLMNRTTPAIANTSNKIVLMPSAVIEYNLSY